MRHCNLALLCAVGLGIESGRQYLIGGAITSVIAALYPSRSHTLRGRAGPGNGLSVSPSTTTQEPRLLFRIMGLCF